MKEVARRTCSPRVQARCLYWEARAADSMSIEGRVALLDSAEQYALLDRDMYGIQRIRLSKSGWLKRQGNYLEAYRLSTESAAFFERIGDRMYQAKAEVQNGVTLYEVGDYEAAVSELEAATRHFIQAGSVACAAKNQLNLCNALYFNGEQDRSLELLRALIQDSVSQQDTAFLVNAMVSFFSVSENRDSSYVEEALALARQQGEPELILLAMMGKGAAFLVRGDADSALFYYRQCSNIRKAYPGNVVNQLPLAYAFSEIFGIKGQADSAYRYLKSYVRLKDSILDQDRLMQYRSSEWRAAVDAARAEAGLLKEKNRLERIVAYSIMIFLAIAGSMGTYILFLSRKKERMEKQLKEAELRELFLQNRDIKEELETQHREMTSKTLLMMEKNNTLQDILREIEQKIKKKKIPYAEGRQLIFWLKQLAQEGNEWAFFKQHFDSVHPDFFVRLKKDCPQLSENDLKLCALVRTGMGNKEIAQILGVNTGTVFTTRYRIRKKLNIRLQQQEDAPGQNGESSLENFLRRY